ncbi:hypothetical protein MTR67_009565 [Solanum verrucosum]|uniref:Protein kinase domain-containing protein n=1 Tax=Solanum verrucosum TaxID=315347 RepID=A0AAF0TKC3_SOLVR|nr:hypothetical protein MTR67_009565 [Solanum verrucosum]
MGLLFFTCFTRKKTQGWGRVKGRWAGGNIVLLLMGIWYVGLGIFDKLDCCNLVFGDSSNLTAGEYLWQSFDHLVDTLLPGMKLGWDKKTGIDRSMRSWRTEGDPTPGDYLFRLDSGDSAASPDAWGMMNFTEGCRRNISLNYTNKDVFVENIGLKLPDNATYWGMLYHQECEQKCLNERSYAPVSDSRWKHEWTVFASLISELALLIILLIVVVVLCQKMRTKVLDEQEINQLTNSQGALLQGNNVIAYDSSDLAIATNNFSLVNKIGHGGFDNVYKGVLENGVEIAVKKQNVTSRQGFTEFENEVKGTVTWPMRFNIIKGIAKGLVYMHHDSRLTIIHRDLKASNVLLDREMTPKISDLGLSRVFEDDVEEKTQHLIGTRGYMPPEYMKNGHYSTKSDVFSFGILALEIVNGQKNYDYRHPVYDIGLVDYASRIWSKGNAIELLDPMIEKPGDENEVLGCILVGLLCCQRRAQDRPSMIQVVSLLEENEMSRLNFVPQEPLYSKELSRGAGVETA